ncbi:MAG: hypothetical protein AAGB46_10420, partial [Verrucomicrobiota bacterium]
MELAIPKNALTRLRSSGIKELAFEKACVLISRILSCKVRTTMPPLSFEEAAAKGVPLNTRVLREFLSDWKGTTKKWLLEVRVIRKIRNHSSSNHSATYWFCSDIDVEEKTVVEIRNRSLISKVKKAEETAKPATYAKAEKRLRKEDEVKGGRGKAGGAKIGGAGSAEQLVKAVPRVALTKPVDEREIKERGDISFSLPDDLSIVPWDKHAEPMKELVFYVPRSVLSLLMREVSLKRDLWKFLYV